MREFERTCDMWAQTLLDRIFGTAEIKGNYDNFIIVDSGGLKGLGKTVFSVQLSKAICRKIKYPYSRKELMVLDPTQEKIEERIKSLPEGAPIHIDEAILVSYNRDFMERGNKDLNKFFAICRKWHKIIIFNIPDFWELDKGIIAKADYRALATIRGTVQIFEKWINPHSIDKWLRKKTDEKVENSITNAVDYIGVMVGNRQCRNYLYDILYDDLPDKEYKEYQEESLLREMESYEFQMMDRWKLRFGVLLRGLVKSRRLTLNEIVGIMNERMQGYARFWRVKPESVMITRDLLKDWSKKLSSLIDEEIMEGGSHQDIIINNNTIENDKGAAPSD